MIYRHHSTPALTLAICFLALPLVSGPRSAEAEIRPEAARFGPVDRIIEEAIERGDIPGGVLLVGVDDQIVYRRAYGSRAIEPQRVPMTEDTIFDLASLSKVVGCATSVVLLIERGEIRLDDKVASYLPDFGTQGKEDITVEQLLLHRGGLPAGNPESQYRDGPEQAWANICALPLSTKPGEQFRYTDIGYIVLGELVRVASGRPLDVFAREEIFEPLGMRHTAYNPPSTWKDRMAPTEQREGRWMIGEVHDPRAYLLGGVAGHAGLFSTVDDLARYCRMILAGGILDGKRIMSEETVREMTRSRCLSDGANCRGYGWDVDTAYSSPRGRIFERGTTFGHTGFTGTAFWLDPPNQTYVIFLTNHLHPTNKGSRAIVALRREVSTAVAEIVLGPAAVAAAAARNAASEPPGAAGADGVRGNPTGPPADVLCGIDVLKAENFRRLAGRKVGIVTNHTARDREGNHLIRLLIDAPDVEVVKLFSPEHGLYGALDERIGHSVDPETGLQVYSLYGETRRPSQEWLVGIDTLVFDIQDIGARFYTYISTLGNCMEEAAKAGIRVVVLDRPNPITGGRVDGPMADEEHLGFTAYMPMPVTHGMTVGELARLFNAEKVLKEEGSAPRKGIGCELDVIEIQGWRRSMWWDQTGLTWINPSPNMRNLTQATLYPAVCLLERTNVSVGRGTDQPFEVFGAPWIDGRKLSAALNAAELPGLRFVPIEFTPASSKHAGKPCQGVYILVTDRNAIELARSGLTMAWHLMNLFGDQFEVDRVVNLMHNAQTLAALKETSNPATLPELWKDDVEAFNQMRARYLIYP